MKFRKENLITWAGVLIVCNEPVTAYLQLCDTGNQEGKVYKFDISEMKINTFYNNCFFIYCGKKLLRIPILNKI